MGAANKKGWVGETKAVEFLNELFKDYQYKWYRTPSQEKMKMTRFGDVNLIPKGGIENCVLKDFLFDVQRGNTLTPTAKLKKGIDELESSGRRHAIYFGQETRRNGAVPNFEMIAMTPKTFRYIIRWLTSYVEESNAKRNL